MCRADAERPKRTVEHPADSGAPSGGDGLGREVSQRL